MMGSDVGGVSSSLEINGRGALVTLGLLRILTGLLWVTQLLWKPPFDFGSKGACPTNLNAHRLAGLCDWMHREALHPIHATLIAKKYFPFEISISTDAYANFVKNVVIPNYYLFGWLTFLTESAVAISLVLGLFVRLGGLVGALWALNLAVGLWSVPGEWYWSYLMLFAINLILALVRAGRALGVDALLVRSGNPVIEFLG